MENHENYTDVMKYMAKVLQRMEGVFEQVDPNCPGNVDVTFDGETTWMSIIEVVDGAVHAQHKPLYEVVSMLKDYFTQYGRGYCISSFMDFDGTWFANISGTIHMKSFQGQFEPEVILKACEWIIDTEDRMERGQDA